MNRIYLDHAATTPVHPEVIAVMVNVMEQGWGNPSSLHTEGRIAKKALEQARIQVATLLETTSDRIFFTASGSEADQWAILGMAQLFQANKGNFITAQIEHSAVRNVAKRLTTEGWTVRWLKSDSEGRYLIDQLQSLSDTDTRFISLMYCNNELGTLQDISALANIAHASDALFHTDAVQAIGKYPSPISMGADLVSVASHKINGPKGIGALWVREGIDLPPWIAAASQERGKHAGTEGLPAIVGFGKACELWHRNATEYRDRIATLKQRFIQQLTSLGCEFTFISPIDRCSDSILNLRFANTEAEALLLGFDLAGVAASAGSACASGALKPSQVLIEIGLTEKAANECIRFSFGPSLSLEDVTDAANRVATVIAKQRRVVNGG